MSARYCPDCGMVRAICRETAGCQPPKIRPATKAELLEKLSGLEYANKRLETSLRAARERIYELEMKLQANELARLAGAAP